MPRVSVEIPLGNILFYEKLRSEMNFHSAYSMRTNTITSHSAEERHCQGGVFILYVSASHSCLCHHDWKSNIMMSSRSVYSEPAKHWIKL